MPAVASVIVVGAGVVGSSIAYRLAAGGADVTLLDAGEPGAETSSRSFAWLNANGKPPEPYFRLNFDGIHAHRRLRDALGRGPWLYESGNIEIAAAHAEDRHDMHSGWVSRTRPADRHTVAGLAQRVESLRALGYAAELIDQARARELEPHVSFEGAAALAYFADECWAHGPTLVRTLVEEAVRLGARVMPWTGVTGIEVGASGVQVRTVGVVAGAGAWPRAAAGAGAARMTGEIPRSAGDNNPTMLAADFVVVAAGRFADRVAALADVRVPLAPTCGLLAVTAPIERAPSRVIHAPDLQIRPDGDGRLVLQAGDTDARVGLETAESPALPGCETLLQRARKYVPGLANGAIEAARVGIRPMPADGYPIVGPVPGRDRVTIALTHSGMTLGPLLGELVASELLTGRPDERLRDFRPDRLVALA